MDSLKKAINKLADFALTPYEEDLLDKEDDDIISLYDEGFKPNDEELDFEKNPELLYEPNLELSDEEGNLFDTDLEEDSDWEDNDELGEEPKIISVKDFFDSFKEEEKEPKIEASKNVLNLLKIANKLLKTGAYEDDEHYYENLTEQVSDNIEQAILPDNINLFDGPADDDEIPDEYKMDQINPEEDVDVIFGLNEEGPFVDDPITGKKHYDLESDFTILDDDYDEKSTEAPTEVQDFIRQMEKELAKEDDLNPVAYYKNKFTKKS